MIARAPFVCIKIFTFGPQEWFPWQFPCIAHLCLDWHSYLYVSSSDGDSVHTGLCKLISADLAARFPSSYLEANQILYFFWGYSSDFPLRNHGYEASAELFIIETLYTLVGAEGRKDWALLYASDRSRGIHVSE